MLGLQEGQSQEDARVCPACGTGRLGLKTFAGGGFVGCSSYPDCSFSRPLSPTDPSQAGQPTANCLIDHVPVHTFVSHEEIATSVALCTRGRLAACEPSPLLSSSGSLHAPESYVVFAAQHVRTMCPGSDCRAHRPQRRHPAWQPPGWRTQHHNPLRPFWRLCPAGQAHVRCSASRSGSSHSKKAWQEQGGEGHAQESQHPQRHRSHVGQPGHGCGVAGVAQDAGRASAGGRPRRGLHRRLWPLCAARQSQCSFAQGELWPIIWLILVKH